MRAFIKVLLLGTILVGGSNAWTKEFVTRTINGVKYKIYDNGEVHTAADDAYWGKAINYGHDTGKLNIAWFDGNRGWYEMNRSLPSSYEKSIVQNGVKNLADVKAFVAAQKAKDTSLPAAERQAAAQERDTMVWLLDDSTGRTDDKIGTIVDLATARNTNKSTAERMEAASRVEVVMGGNTPDDVKKWKAQETARDIERQKTEAAAAKAKADAEVAKFRADAEAAKAAELDRQQLADWDAMNAARTAEAEAKSRDMNPTPATDGARDKIVDALSDGAEQQKEAMFDEVAAEKKGQNVTNDMQKHMEDQSKKASNTVKGWLEKAFGLGKNAASTVGDKVDKLINPTVDKSIGDGLGFDKLGIKTDSKGANYVIDSAANEKLEDLFNVKISKEDGAMVVTALDKGSDADKAVGAAFEKLANETAVSKLGAGLNQVQEDRLREIGEKLKTAEGEDKKNLEKEQRELSSDWLKQKNENLANTKNRVAAANDLVDALTNRATENLTKAGISADGAIGSGILSGKTGADLLKSAADSATGAANTLGITNPKLDTSNATNFAKDMKALSAAADKALYGKMPGTDELPEGAVTWNGDQPSYDYDKLREFAAGDDDLLNEIGAAEALHNQANDAQALANNPDVEKDGAALNAAKAAQEDANKDLAAQEAEAPPQIPQHLKVWDVVQTALEILANTKHEKKVDENKEVIVQAGDIGEAVGAEDATELADIDSAALANTAAGAAALAKQLLETATVDMGLLSTDVKKPDPEPDPETPPATPTASLETGNVNSGVGLPDGGSDEDGDDGDNDDEDDNDDDGDKLTPDQQAYVDEITSRRKKLVAQYANAGVMISEGMNAISSQFMERAKALVDFANAQNPPTETGSFGLVQDAARYVLLETLRGTALSSVQMGLQAAELLRSQDVIPPSPEATDNNNNDNNDNNNDDGGK